MFAHPHAAAKLGDSVAKNTLSITMITNNSSKVPILKTAPVTSAASE